MARHTAFIETMPSYPDSHALLPETMGIMAVNNASRAAWHEMQTDYLKQHPGQGNEQVATRFAETFYGDVEQELIDTRSRLKTLTEKQKDTIDPYIETLVDDVPADAFEYSRLSDWLADGADDAELLDFLGRHADLIAEQQQSPEVQQAIVEAKAEYVSTVKDLVAEEYYDEHALTTLQRTLDAKVYIGDIWDMTLRGGYGYHVDGTDYIVVGQGTGRSRDEQSAQIKANIKEVVPHELSHVQFGAKMPRIVYESIAEWSAMRARTGEAHSLSPYKNNNDSGVYAHERLALSTALGSGKEPIELRSVTRAYSSEGPYSVASLEMRQAVFNAWGDYYFLDKLDKVYDAPALAQK